MATGVSDYPTSLDTTSNQPVASTLVSIELDGDGTANNVHSNVHGVHSTSIVQLETKIGTGASTATANKVLRATGIGTSAWAQVGLTTDVTGILPVANGGTGATSIADNAVLISQDSGTDTVGALVLDANGEIVVGGTSGPAVESAADLAGTGIDASTGDGTLALNIAAAQTSITSILAANVKIGEDAETIIDFETVNEIHFDADNAERAKITATGLTMADDTVIVLGDEGQVIFNDDAPSTDHTGTGVVVKMTATDGVGLMEAVYINGSGILDEADADAVTTMPAIGLALEANTSGGNAEIKVLIQGVVVDASWSFAVGADLFIGTTDNAGLITDTAPSGSGDTVQKVGVALTATSAFLNFNTTEVLLA
jgi:hypothetical protein